MRLLIASLAVCVVSSIAAAAPKANVTLVPTLDAPIFQATIVGAPPVESTSLTIRDAETGVRVVASGVTPYRDGHDALAIAFVYAGGEVFVGNDDVEAYDSPEPVTVQMPSAVAAPAASACSGWWLQVGLGVGFVGLLALGGWDREPPLVR